MNKKPETEGKVVMVEFWATWCGPCVANIPHLNELHDKYSDNVAIIGVSDEEPNTIKGFMKKHKFKYAVASDQTRAIINAVKPQGIPHAIVMSPDGIVRWQGHPGGLDNTILEQIIRASDIKPAAGTSKFRWVTSDASRSE
jgi:thiol-disulfide isomerase/thioredoxin